jgi:3-oxo-5-alpha-steroid 4-dehydrogenase 1
MSPIHILVWIFAVCFQLANGLSIGGWLAGYGPTTQLEWQDSGTQSFGVGWRVVLGLLVWMFGLAGNIYHDDELRDIRRAALKEQKQRENINGEKPEKRKGVDKVYMIPQNGLFKWILYPHYLLEWVEWGGFWLMGGVACIPARNFLMNEMTAMIPRGVRGVTWYRNRFGKEKVGNRGAFIPGVL